MSTYLVALIVSDFDCLTNKVSSVGEYGDIQINVCGQPDAVADGLLNYAITIATNVIEYYEKFYRVKYPLPKCGLLIFS